MTTTVARRRPWVWIVLSTVLGLSTPLLFGQAPSAPLPGAADAARVDARIRALERDAEALAARARTILGDLQALEVERDLRREQARRADEAARTALAGLRQASQRVSDLEQRRLAELPSLEVQFVELYKNGREGNLRALVSADSATSFGRMARLLAAMGAVNASRLAEHRQTLDALKAERTRLEGEVKALQEADARARAARVAAERAVAARTALIADLDARRDLAAQYLGELQAAFDRLQAQLADLGGGPGPGPAPIPLAPFKGDLDWPAAGELSSPFGDSGGRLGGSAARNGIEIDVAEGTPVHAVHGGTVGFADVFPAFGRLVILEHGANTYSLYGYLSEIRVKTGDRLEAGADIGRVGLAPAGPPALYFELRVDGQSTDPVEWLRPR